MRLNLPVALDQVAAAGFPARFRAQILPVQQLWVGMVVGWVKVVDADEEFCECREIVRFGGSDDRGHGWSNIEGAACQGNVPPEERLTVVLPIERSSVR